jgi:hypothetical protein
MPSRRSTVTGGPSRKLRIDASMDTEEICEILWDAKNNSHLNSISFDEVHLDTTIASAVIELLQSFGRTWEKLNFEFCQGQVDVVLQAALVLNCVKHVFLASDAPQEEIMAKFGTLLRINKSLTSLWLLIPISVGVAESLGGSLRHNQHLEKLSLSGANWEPNAAKALATSGLQDNSVLRTMDLSCCFLPDDELSVILQALVGHPSLQGLDLSQNSAQRATPSCLAGMMLHDECKLQSIDLREQRLDGAGDSNKEEEEEEGLDITAVARALEVNETLEILKLSNNRLGDNQVVALALGLQGNSCLQELDLQWNAITEKGLNILTEALPDISALEVLLLGGNAFGEDGYTMLESLPEDDQSIQTVNERDLEESWGVSSGYFQASYSGSLLQGEVPL